MADQTTHGGCFACGDPHTPVLYSTSNPRKIARALAAAGRQGVKLGAPSVALCAPCFGPEER